MVANATAAVRELTRLIFITIARLRALSCVPPNDCRHGQSDRQLLITISELKGTLEDFAKVSGVLRGTRNTGNGATEYGEESGIVGVRSKQKPA